MASLKGISLKKLKRFVGMEGEAYQGDMYLRNKKIAFWSMDGNGGMDWFDFEPEYSESKFEELVRTTNEPHRFYNGTSMEINGELFMNELLELTLSEKAYKKYVKEGYDLVVKAGSKHLCDYIYAFSKVPVEKAIADIRKDMQPKLERLPDLHEEIEFKIYRSLDDFKIGEPYSLDQITR